MKEAIVRLLTSMIRGLAKLRMKIKSESYITHARYYEQYTLEGMEGAKQQGPDCYYIPKYGRSEQLHLDTTLCESIEVGIVASERRLGNQSYLLPTAFADYLYDHYGVSDVDCEFMAMMCNRILVGTTHNVAKSTTKRFFGDMSDYIDWDAYYKDHPEKGPAQ